MENTSLKEIKNLILELEKERGIHQFLFMDKIGFEQTCLLRNEVDKFLIKNKNIKEIDFILESPGGRPNEAYKVIRELRENFETVNIIVPFWAKSAATLLAMGGSNIIMNSFAEFGPIDAQLEIDDAEKPEAETQSALIDELSLERIETRAMQMFQAMYESFTNVNSTDSGKKIKINRVTLSSQLLKFVSDFYEPILDKIDPYRIGTKRRYLDIGEQYAKRILAFYADISSKNIRKFTDFLVNGCPDHGFVIDYELVKIFLKNVIKTSDISKTYDNKITKLSKILMENKVEYKYVGFIEKTQTNTNKNKKNKRQKK